MNPATVSLVGEWTIARYRRARRRRGTLAVARQLRRMGVPLSLTLKILGVGPTGRNA